MRKTIDFTDEEIKILEEHKEKIGVNSFSEAVRNFIKINDEGNLQSDSNFALLADAIIKMDDKINVILRSIAPKSAGEVKK
jgi:predicted CopG family antitoxin